MSISPPPVGPLSRRPLLYAHFPNEVELAVMKQLFRQTSGSPGVVGCIDGTRPDPDTMMETGSGLKGYHSINVQISCNTNYNIFSLDLSTHTHALLKSAS